MDTAKHVLETQELEGPRTRAVSQISSSSGFKIFILNPDEEDILI